MGHGTFMRKLRPDEWGVPKGAWLEHPSVLGHWLRTATRKHCLRDHHGGSKDALAWGCRSAPLPTGGSLEGRSEQCTFHGLHYRPACPLLEVTWPHSASFSMASLSFSHRAAETLHAFGLIALCCICCKYFFPSLCFLLTVALCFTV